MKPVLAIVGRPNVGKSALFNRISGRQISLVFDRPGVTRDRITADCLWEGIPFTLIDTGGIGLDDESGFEEAIQREVEVSLGTATDILMVVDGRDGLNTLDTEVARRLRHAGRKVVLAVNKIDEAGTTGWEGEFQRLGIDAIFPVSATHGRGVDALMRHLARDWPEPEALAASQRRQPVRVAIVGRPNAGKSSLINALLDEDRVIVSPIAGTTRDAVDVHFTRNDQDYWLIDTAGMRRKARISDPLETIMSGRSAHAINRAEVCVLVLDAEHGVGVQEKKIAGLIQEARKPCLVLINKWDLTEGVEVRRPEPPNAKQMRHGDTLETKPFPQEYEDAVRRHLFFLDYAPIEMVSARDKTNMSGWVDALERVGRNRRTEIPAGPLNRLLKQLIERHHPTSNAGRPLKIYYAAQVKEAKCHTLAVFINDRKLWTADYARYLEQHIREEFPLQGCPLHWDIRDKDRVAGEGGGRKSHARNPRAAASNRRERGSARPSTRRARPKATGRRTQSSPRRRG
jgi:GTP-binding protein